MNEHAAVSFEFEIVFEIGGAFVFPVKLQDIIFIRFLGGEVAVGLSRYANLAVFDRDRIGAEADQVERRKVVSWSEGSEFGIRGAARERARREREKGQKSGVFREINR